MEKCSVCQSEFNLKSIESHIVEMHIGLVEGWQCGICQFAAGNLNRLAAHCYRTKHDPKKAVKSEHFENYAAKFIDCLAQIIGLSPAPAASPPTPSAKTTTAKGSSPKINPSLLPKNMICTPSLSSSSSSMKPPPPLAAQTTTKTSALLTPLSTSSMLLNSLSALKRQNPIFPIPSAEKPSDSDSVQRKDSAADGDEIEVIGETADSSHQISQSDSNSGNQISSADSLTNTKLRTFRCRFCRYTSTVCVRYKLHLARMHPSGKRNPLTCQVCGQEFTDKDVFHRHKHRGGGAMMLCPNDIKKESLIAQDEESAMPDSTTPSVSDPEAMTNSLELECPGCNRAFNARAMGAFRIHKDACLRPAFRCRFCSYSTKNPTSFRMHLKNLHPSGVFNPHTCQICGLEFTSKETFAKHKHRPEETRNYPCLYCSYRGHQWASVKRHVNARHPGGYVNTCPKCSSGFVEQNAFKWHSLACTGTMTAVESIDKLEMSKRPSCRKCRQQFDSKSEAADHQVSCQYTCPFCNQSFRLNGAMRKHMRARHKSGGLNMYTCKICGKEHDDEPELRAHTLQHTENVQCALCDYKSWCWAPLRSHYKKTHGNSVSGCCIKCGIQFYDPKEYRAHAEKEHDQVIVFKRLAPCRKCKEEFGFDREARQTHKCPKHHCPYCGRKETRAKDMAKHVARHEKMHLTPQGGPPKRRKLSTGSNDDSSGDEGAASVDDLSSSDLLSFSSSFSSSVVTNTTYSRSTIGLLNHSERSTLHQMGINDDQTVEEEMMNDSKQSVLTSLLHSSSQLLASGTSGDSIATAGQQQLPVACSSSTGGGVTAIKIEDMTDLSSFNDLEDLVNYEMPEGNVLDAILKVTNGTFPVIKREAAGTTSSPSSRGEGEEENQKDGLAENEKDENDDARHQDQQEEENEEEVEENDENRTTTTAITDHYQSRGGLDENQDQRTSAPKNEEVEDRQQDENDDEQSVVMPSLLVSNHGHQSPARENNDEQRCQSAPRGGSSDEKQSKASQKKNDHENEQQDFTTGEDETHGSRIRPQSPEDQEERTSAQKHDHMDLMMSRTTLARGIKSDESLPPGESAEICVPFHAPPGSKDEPTAAATQQVEEEEEEEASADNTINNNEGVDEVDDETGEKLENESSEEAPEVSSESNNNNMDSMKSIGGPSRLNAASVEIDGMMTSALNAMTSSESDIFGDTSMTTA